MKINHGFLSVSMIMTISFGALLILLTTAALSLFVHQTNIAYQRYRLSRNMQLLLNKIAKQIKRAGFLYPIHEIKKKHPVRPLCKPLIVMQHLQEIPNSCILFYYDRQRTGMIRECLKQHEAEIVGYRLHKGNIETQRGINHCNGSHWESISDRYFITIQSFQISYSLQEKWIRLTLQANLTLNPNITKTLNAAVMLENTL